MKKSGRILIVSNGGGTSELATRVEALGYGTCAVAPAGTPAGEPEPGAPPDLALVDLGSSAEDGAVGIAAGEQAGVRFDVPVVYLVGDADDDLLQRLWSSAPAGCVSKRCDDRQLRLSIEGALAAHGRRRAARETESSLHGALAELRQQNELLENVFDSLHEGVSVFDRDGKYVMLNREGRRLARIEGQDEDLSILISSFELLHDDDGMPFRPEELPVARVLGGEAFDEVLLRVPTPDGENDLYFSASGRPLRDADGAVRGGVTVFRDITERRLREQRLQALAEEHRKHWLALETVLNSISDGVVVVDERGNFTVANPAAERVVGMGVTDTGPAEWTDTYGLFQRDKVTPFPPEELPLALAMNGEATDDVEMFVRNAEVPDGVWMQVSGRPLKAENGKSAGGVIVLRDVSGARAREDELKRLAAATLEQKQTMEAVFNSMSDGVVVVDKQGGVTIFNPSAERVLGIPRSSTGTWRNEFHMFYPDRVTPFPREDYPLAAALRGRTTESVDVFVRHPRMRDGRHISASGKPLLDEHGQVQGAVAVFRDVTERVRAQEALAQAFSQGRLEVVDTLLHNVGNAVNSVAVGVATLHDLLRNDEPLRRFAAVAEALAAHREDWHAWLRDDPQGRQALPFVLALAGDFEKQHEQLAELTERVRSRVERIVDIIRTQRSLGGGSMERKEIDLQDAIVKAVDVLRDSLKRRGIAIAIDCARAPERIRVQDSQFHQMLVNLVKNAMDAIGELLEAGGPETPPRIRIVAYSAPGAVILDVIDTGIGIPPERFNVIFSAGYTTKESGSGLGLHASANFVIGSGGSIQPLSEGHGTGTTMRVTLRTTPEAPQPAADGAGGLDDAAADPR